MHFRAVDGKHRDPGQPSVGAERKNLAEQAAKRGLVALPNLAIVV